jgi:rRNA maturation endonuclease Nob1
MNFQCLACKKVLPILGTPTNTCLACGSSDGQVVSKEISEKQQEVGAIFNIDLRTGKAVKPKKRR